MALLYCFKQRTIDIASLNKVCGNYCVCLWFLAVVVVEVSLILCIDNVNWQIFQRWGGPKKIFFSSRLQNTVLENKIQLLLTCAHGNIRKEVTPDVLFSGKHPITELQILLCAALTMCAFRIKLLRRLMRGFEFNTADWWLTFSVFLCWRTLRLSAKEIFSERQLSKHEFKPSSN